MKNYRKIIIIGLATVLAVVAGYTVYNHLPTVKVSKAIAAGDKYKNDEDYESAIDSYSEAIQIDSHSVKAYSNMAGAFLSIDDFESAKQVLYDGWQNTENSSLMDNYHTVVLNEAVDAMNDQRADMDTALAILSVLKENNTNSDAIMLLGEAYSRVFQGGSDTFSYEEYAAFLSDLVEVYNAAPSDEMREVVLKYAVPGLDSFKMDYEDAVAYKELLESVESTVGTSQEIDYFKRCITNAQQVQSIFADIFVQLDVGNVDELRSFIISDEYLAYRDIFLNKEYSPQENTTYITVSREAMIFNKVDDSWSYRFLDFDENPSTKGVITVWANYFEDGGVQRSAISYEPESIDDSYYPHTKYSVTYLNSYVTSGKVARMNYRLETSVTMQDGEELETIVSDWGGPDEAVMDIKTIESRIRA